MPRPPADKNLRRLVTEIARATPDDIEAIFAQLEPDHRARAQALLAEFIARPDHADTPSGGLGEGPRGLSPWLEERILAAVPQTGQSRSTRLTPAPTRPCTSFNMTSDALKALHDAAKAAAPRGRAPSAGSWVGWATDLSRHYRRSRGRP